MSDIIEILRRWTVVIAMTIYISMDATAGISCNTLLEGNVVSAYTVNVFSLDKADMENVIAYNWTLSLTGKDGKLVSVETSPYYMMSVTKINNPDNYLVLNGAIKGKVECKVTKAQGSVEIEPMDITVELKPVITYISEIQKIKDGPDSYHIEFDVTFYGADYITVETEEDNSSILTDKRFNGPGNIHVYSSSVSVYDYAWVYLSVSNKYGNAKHTIELDPASEGIDNVESAHTHTTTILHTLQGIKIYESHGDALPCNLPKGIYIKTTISAQGQRKSTKIAL